MKKEGVQGAEYEVSSQGKCCKIVQICGQRESVCAEK